MQISHTAALWPILSLCASCHTAALWPVLSLCASCHTAALWPVLSLCASCHTAALWPVLSLCASCHTAALWPVTKTCEFFPHPLAPKDDSLRAHWRPQVFDRILRCRLVFGVTTRKTLTRTAPVSSRVQMSRPCLSV